VPLKPHCVSTSSVTIEIVIAISESKAPALEDPRRPQTHTRFLQAYCAISSRSKPIICAAKNSGRFDVVVGMRHPKKMSEMLWLHEDRHTGSCRRDPTGGPGSGQINRATCRTRASDKDTIPSEKIAVVSIREGVVPVRKKRDNSILHHAKVIASEPESSRRWQRCVMLACTIAENIGEKPISAETRSVTGKSPVE